MKNLLTVGFLLVSSITYGSDDFKLCNEGGHVIDKQLKEIEADENRIRTECSIRNDGSFGDGASCNIALMMNDLSQRTLQQSMQKIQEFCAQKYDQQQQQQQQSTPQYKQLQMTEDQILNTDLKIILICEGPRYEGLSDCLLPNSHSYQQPQDRTGCSHQAIYLKKNNFFAIGQSLYTCQ